MYGKPDPGAPYFWAESVKNNIIAIFEPAAGTDFFWEFSPHYLDPWGEKLYFPPIIRTPGGKTKKVFSPLMGKKKAPLVNSSSLLVGSLARSFRELILRID